MMELSKYGRYYVPERSYVGKIKNEESKSGQWWLGILLIIVLGLCPLAGLFIV